MASPSFTRMATVTASTKRNAAGTKITGPVAKLTALSILPLMPLDNEIIERYRLESPRAPFVTYTQGAPDIIKGDVLTVSAVDYQVLGAGPWPTDRSYIEIVVDKVLVS